MRNNSDNAGSRGGTAPGLYVHVPFCKTKCPYCDFYSITSGVATGRWLDALSREAALHRGAFGTFDTLYVGGGTPSVLDEREIHSLFDALRASFDFAPDSEVTIEANPDDVTRSKLDAWLEAGVNRVSLGVQSFDDGELRFLARRHDAAKALEAIAHLRGAGISNVGLDLMYGFAGQSLESWERSMQRALELSPEHLSCYQMTIEGATEFGRMLETGALERLGEESERAFFMKTSEFFTAHGYIHYEISNFARDEAFLSRHNDKYWRHAPYLGLGPSAHSFRNGKRWWNARSVDAYCGALESGGSPVDGMETLSKDELAFEEIFLGFRTRDGVALEALGRYPGWRRALDRLIAESLVIVADGRAVPTVKGFCVADRLAVAFAG
ncbi:MAG: radical SAM family heme chaperone HemW [Candidatus Krumholzibacteriaceae bacterium]